MNRTITLVASILGIPSKHMALGLLLVLITSVTSAYSQSRDKNNPTRLTSKEIAGVIGDNRGENYYYTFFAGPGEVTLTLSVESDRRRAYNLNGVLFELFNEDGRRIAFGQGLASKYHEAEPVVERVSFTRRQRVLLRINIVEQNSGSGKYQLQLGGAVHVGDNVTEQSSNLDSEDVPCLPKSGRLTISMKDGSFHVLDISQINALELDDLARNENRPSPNDAAESANFLGLTDVRCLPKSGRLNIGMKDGSVHSINIAQINSIFTKPKS